MSRVDTPIVCVVIGEGGSGGALGIGIGDPWPFCRELVLLGHQSRGARGFCGRTTSTPTRPPRALKFTSKDLLRLGVVDEVVPEPPAGRTGPSADGDVPQRGALEGAARSVGDPGGQLLTAGSAVRQVPTHGGVRDVDRGRGQRGSDPRLERGQEFVGQSFSGQDRLGRVDGLPVRRRRGQRRDARRTRCRSYALRGGTACRPAAGLRCRGLVGQPRGWWWTAITRRKNTPRQRPIMSVMFNSVGPDHRVFAAFAAPILRSRIATPNATRRGLTGGPRASRERLEAGDRRGGPPVPIAARCGLRWRCRHPLTDRGRDRRSGPRSSPAR